MLDNASVVEVDQCKWRLSFILLLNIYIYIYIYMR